MTKLNPSIPSSAIYLHGNRNNSPTILAPDGLEYHFMSANQIFQMGLPINPKDVDRIRTQNGTFVNKYTGKYY